ncbi:hypothetical protein CWC45_09060 [Neisseria sp. N177_16]|nr:hypothetical protein CWC45_09060 [Neisseria sp. N177_16]
MSYGLNIWDDEGNLILDTSEAPTKIVKLVLGEERVQSGVVRLPAGRSRWAIIPYYNGTGTPNSWTGNKNWPHVWEGSDSFYRISEELKFDWGNVTPVPLDRYPTEQQIQEFFFSTEYINVFYSNVNINIAFVEF